MYFSAMYRIDYVITARSSTRGLESEYIEQKMAIFNLCTWINMANGKLYGHGYC